MSDSTNRQIGFFIVPAEHLDELHALEAALEELRRNEDDPQYLAWWFYRKNQIFERAREVATVSAVIECDSKDVDTFLTLWSWLLKRFRDGDERHVLNPDELAPIARELPGIRSDDVVRWARKPRQISRKKEPLLVELFDILVRTVAAAPAAPSGFAMLSWYEKYRHPPEPPPPRPKPEPPPPDEDEGALMGWFAVPAEHLDALQDIAAERDVAFRQERMADFHALETRLFERAKAVARASAVFNAWAYREASRIWWEDLEGAARQPLPPTFLDPEWREYWGSWMSRKRLATVRKLAHSGRPGLSEETEAQVGELFQALRRVTTAKRAAGCGLVIAWWFAQPPAWSRYDDAATRAARLRMYELKAELEAAEARLRAIAAKQRRARARASEAAPGAAPGAMADAAANTGRAVPAQAMTQAMTELGDDLESRFPWLSRLPNREDIVASFAQQLAGAPPARVPIALTALLAEDFAEGFAQGSFGGDTRVERAGRQAMAEAMARHPAWVELAVPRRGKPELRVYLDGQRLQVHEGGVSADAFFARGGGALLDVQAAWHQAVIEEAQRARSALHEAHPYLGFLLIREGLRKLNHEEFMKRLDREDRAEARKKRAKARNARAKRR